MMELIDLSEEQTALIIQALPECVDQVVNVSAIRQQYGSTAIHEIKVITINKGEEQ